MNIISVSEDHKILLIFRTLSQKILGASDLNVHDPNCVCPCFQLSSVHTRSVITSYDEAKAECRKDGARLWQLQNLDSYKRFLDLHGNTNNDGIFKQFEYAKWSNTLLGLKVKYFVEGSCYFHGKMSFLSLDEIRKQRAGTCLS